MYINTKWFAISTFHINGIFCKECSKLIPCYAKYLYFRIGNKEFRFSREY
jgi:hypothetical protein